MSGTVALGLVTAGTLLLFMECNRPGRVLPGACGLLFLLLGANRLWAFTSPNDGALWLGISGCALIGLLRWRRWYGVPGVAGSGLLLAAFVQMARHSGGALRPPLAGTCGLLLGTVASFLVMIAGQAWRAKAGHRSASAQGAQTGAVERWGVN